MENPTDELKHRLTYIYILLLIGWFGYFISKYMLHFNDYSEDELIQQSNYFLPPLIGPLAGLITIVFSSARSSLIVAIIFAVLTYALLPLFYDYLWQLL